MRDNCRLHIPPGYRFRLLSLLLSVVGSAKRLQTGIYILLLFCLASNAVVAQRLQDFLAPQPLPEGSTLVIGFLGGLESWNDAHRGVRKIALDLRTLQSPRVFAETVENRHAKRALQLIVGALDRNHNGKLEPDECAAAHIVLFGHSLGGAAAIRTAHVLYSWGVPVLLTVQVDSFGLGDAVIPPNVSNAANFYQRSPLTIQGRSNIRAEDPQRTVILGNFLKAYPFWTYNPRNRADASRLRLTLGGGHARMETDPELWTQVEQLILSFVNELPDMPTGTASLQRH